MKQVFFILMIMGCFPMLSSAQMDCWQEERTVTTDWRDSASVNPFDWTAQSMDFKYMFQTKYEDSLRGHTPLFYGRGFGYDSTTQAFFNTSLPMGNNQLFLNAFEEGGLDYIDYWPEDGWEFISRDYWGGADNRQVLLFIFYNRYRGLYRFAFFSYPMPALLDKMNNLWLELHFHDFRDYEQFALYSSINPVMEAVDHFERSNTMIRPLKIEPHPDGFWAYADFPIIFDPCPCNYSYLDQLDARLLYAEDSESLSENLLIWHDEQSRNTSWEEMDSERLNNLLFTDENQARTSSFAPRNNGLRQLPSWKKASEELSQYLQQDKSGQAAKDAGLSILQAELNSNSEEWGILPRLIDSARTDNRAAASLGSYYNYFNGGGLRRQSRYTAPPIVAVVGEGATTSIAENRPDLNAIAEYRVRLPGYGHYVHSFSGYENVTGTFTLLRSPQLEALPYKVEWQGSIPNSGDLHNNQFHEYRLAAPLDFMLNPNAKLKPLKIMAGIQYKVKESASFSQGYSYWGSTANRHNKLAGPVLLGPKTDAEEYDLFTEHYFSHHSWDSVTRDPSEAVLQDVVSLYGGGQELAYWPADAAMPTDKASDLTFRTPLFSIQDLHKYSFKVWGHPNDVDMVLKVYAFFVPEEDPGREPLLKIFTYHLHPDVRIRTEEQRQFSFAYDIAGKRTNQIEELEPSLYEDLWLDDLLIAPREQLVLDGFNFGPIISENGRVRITESGSIIASNIYLNQPLELDPGVQVTLYSYHTQLANNFSLPPGLQIIALDTDVEPHTANMAIQEAACTSPSYLNTERRLEEVEEGTAVLFPNPADEQSQLQFKLESRAEVSIEVFDVLSRQHWSGSWNLPEGPHRRFIQVSDWTNGIYFCRLSINGETQIFTLLIQH